ncbi:MAG: hypothetical protein WD904_04005 [Dehalococcoidia bacterium]
MIEVQYDPNVILFDACDPLDRPPGFIFATACEPVDNGGGPEDDAVVTVGGALDPQTEEGIASIVTLATVTFHAVGNDGDSTDLDIEIVSFLGPDPEGIEQNPTTTNGFVQIGPPPPATQTPTPSPTPSQPPTPSPSPTPMSVGGSVQLTTAAADHSRAGLPLAATLLGVAAATIAVVASSLTHRRWP